MAAWVPDMFCDLFLSEISQKMITTQQPLKLEKKYIFFRILEIFGCMFDNVYKKTNFTQLNLYPFSCDYHALYCMKHPNIPIVWKLPNTFILLI